MRHILGNKVLQYDVDDRGIIVDEREIDRTVNPKPNIADWVKEHMVFWYDMSKPVDVYAENFNDWFINSKKATVKLESSSSVTIQAITQEHVGIIYKYENSKRTIIKVNITGITEEIKGRFAFGFADVTGSHNIILENGYFEFDTDKYEGIVGWYGFKSMVPINICNITIEQIPSGQSVPTNEILKANPYLQDFSGNNRPLKLNNFLFAAMSGAGGYELNWTDQSIWTRPLGNRFNGAIEPHKLTVTSVLNSAAIIETQVPSYSKKFKVKVSGVIDEIVAYIYKDTKGVQQRFDIREDGEYELPSNYVVEANFNMGWRIFTASYPHTCNITIEQIPVYPNALVTDGVDDYGQIQNLQHGVKVLFVTINPFIDGKFIYDQRLNNIEPWLFAVFNYKGSIAYNSRNSNGKTYIDGTLNESTIVSALLNKKQIITIVNNDVTGDKTKTPVFFSNTDHNSGWISSAFYNSIGFDSVPTKETDGFTEQDLINYVLENLITK